LVWCDGQTIITASSDGSIRFRDAKTLDPLRVIDHQPEVQALAIAPMADGWRRAALTAR
jgi:WD40 repeat protein